MIDHGAETYDAEDDYPSFCIPAAEGVVGDPGSLGIVIGGSGNGEAIAANKVDGIRCALAWNEDTAKLGRQHNNANVVSVGGRMHTQEEATQLIEWFLETPSAATPGTNAGSSSSATTSRPAELGSLPLASAGRWSAPARRWSRVAVPL